MSEKIFLIDRVLASIQEKFFFAAP